MAKIILENEGLEEELEDNKEIKDVCEDKLNIPFGCKDGICGTCIIKVTEGNENLSEKNEKEEDLLPEEPNKRLACQCTIKSGTVKIDTSY